MMVRMSAALCGAVMLCLFTPIVEALSGMASIHATRRGRIDGERTAPWESLRA
jgi:hypothetical protein